MDNNTSHRSTHDALDDPRNEHLTLYLNGKLVPKAEAVVSIYDAGFMLGDGVWEGLRLYNGHFVFLAQHLKRLFDGAKAIDLDIGLSAAELRQALYDTAAANGMTNDAHARLMVTRGLKTRPFQDPRLSRQGPTVAIIIEHSKPVYQPEAKGINLFTVAQVRGLPTSQDPQLNSHSKLNCILAGIQAQKAGADEALMLDVHGFVNTTNSCNFFIVRDQAVWTSTGDYCVNGITRQNVIELCRANGIAVFEKNFTLGQTYSADEAFITGTFGAQTAVATIDGRQIGHGKMGPVTQRIRRLYQQHIAELTQQPPA